MSKVYGVIYLNKLLEDVLICVYGTKELADKSVSLRRIEVQKLYRVKEYEVKYHV